MFAESLFGATQREIEIPDALVYEVGFQLPRSSDLIKRAVVLARVMGKLKLL